MYIDTHCHLDDKKFTRLDNIVNEFQAVGVTHIINMGCSLKSSIQSYDLSKKYPCVYFGVGVHPSDIEDFNDEIVGELLALADNPKCLAIGEIGLDYHYLPFDTKKQIDGLVRQIELAYQLKLPISIHCRDATKDMLDLLKDNSSKLYYGGVMHCYSGSVETLRQLLDLGLYVGFGGTSTFKNANQVINSVKYTPLDRILTETDCPYLSPEPFRGQINSPKNIPIINAKLAQIKGIDNLEMANIILKNAGKLFIKLNLK